MTLRSFAWLGASALLTAAPFAHAQSTVTVYGIVDASVRMASNAGSSGGRLYTLGDGAYTGSRLGFRGSEDLGGGLKAFFSLEQGFDPGTGSLSQASATPNFGQSAAPTGRAWGREALVGMTLSTFGTVTLGRQYTFAHTLSSRFQPQGNPSVDALSVFSGHHVTRQDNMAKYVVEFGPARFGASKTFGENANGASWGLAGWYLGGPFEIDAYASDMDSFNGAETRKIRGIGGTWAITPQLKGYLGFMKRSQRVSLQENKIWTAGLNYTAGAFVFTASYGQDTQSHVNPGTRKVAWAGVDYLLSKRTDVYVEIDNNRITDRYPLPAFMATRESQTGITAGLRHRF